MKTMIEMKQAKYAYTKEDGSHYFALNGIDVTIKEGEFVAIIGHNGSGKSTFAKLINALNLPTTGEVIVGGMNTKQEDLVLAIRKMAGVVFQNPDNQLVATVVEEDVAFGPENLGIPQPQIVERVNEALSSVDMLAFKKKAPHMLSGGQKQRIAIAGVLAMHPDILVFDEATAMLDPKGRAEVMDIMKELNKKGMTILYITHFMEEAVYADEVLVLSDGFLLGQGNPREILWDDVLLKQAGLVRPFAAQMAADLKQKGVPIKGLPITTEELTEALCQLQ